MAENTIPAGLYLREWAQAAPDAPVRFEVIEVTPRGSQVAVAVDPVADDAIGNGDGAWSADDALAKVSEILGEPVAFWPKPEVGPVAEDGALAEGSGLTEGPAQ